MVQELLVLGLLWEVNNSVLPPISFLQLLSLLIYLTYTPCPAEKHLICYFAVIEIKEKTSRSTNSSILKANLASQLPGQ